MLYGLGGIRRPFLRDIAGFADAPDYGLRQVINAFLFRAVHLTKTKFRLAFRSFVDSDRHLTAEIVFDEGSFVTRALLVPGIDAEDGEIAGLPFPTAGAGN